MDGGSYIALSGILSEEKKMSMATNNLSNVNTIGYKSSNVLFGEFLSQKAVSILNSGSKKPFVDKAYPITLGSYVNTSQGAVKKTGNRLDLAISGSGYFAIQTPDGIKYTRNGVFSLNEAGELVNQNGFPVLDTDEKPIFLNKEGADVTVTRAGIINLKNSTMSGGIYQGKILMVNFKDSEYLSKYGDTMFSATKDSGVPVKNQDPDILQGYVEESNVNEIKSMVGMINISRVYNDMIEIIKSYGSVNNAAINIVGAAV
ncbi:flagellar basal-body rod protein FlgF [Candidatus Acidulodesulfobacterium sp. H_13]|uniref:flagellar basal-body rod protein FlgF n=1 Tax=Candidatus Acidulodesulfobacterium sp. H_13 TaxID=3395470 RepID=UPI003AF75AE8